MLSYQKLKCFSPKYHANVLPVASTETEGYARNAIFVKDGIVTCVELLSKKQTVVSFVVDAVVRIDVKR